MEEIVYNPIVDKIPSGTLKINDEVTFKIKIRCDLIVNKIMLVLRYEKDNSTKFLECKLAEYDVNYYVYETKTDVAVAGLYWYHFEVETNKGVYIVNKSERYMASIDSHEEFPLTVIKKEIKTPLTYKGGIIYHIFVDRFNRVGKVNVRQGFVYRDDWGGVINKNTVDRTALNYEVFGGNLQGVIAKLDYLKGLGITTIYLSPIFMAPSNHKYDTSNYSIVDPMFGDNKILQELIIKAEDMGIGIILDGVFNHIGSDSIYFNKENKFDSIGAYNSKESKYYNWFNFNNWPDDYVCWWGIKTLPSVNQANLEVQDFISNVVIKYMMMGLQGFRLDVVDEIHHDMLTRICSSIYSVKKDAVIIGEVWEDASTKIAYGKRRGYFLGEELNSVMNYPLKEALIDYAIEGNCDTFCYVYQMIEDNYPNFVKHNLMNLIGSHDTKRIFSILKQKDNPYALYRVITGLQFTFYGVPSIFYGDEIGLEHDQPDFSRKCYPWGNENIEILNWYKILSKIRKNKVFKEGKMELIKADNQTIIYKRKITDEEILVIANLSENDYSYNVDSEYKSLITNEIKRNVLRVSSNDIDILKLVKNN